MAVTTGPAPARRPRTTRPSTSEPAATAPAAGVTPSGEPRRTYVVDTSVLLSDPKAMLRFKEHEVVLPVVVVSELEGKRHHPELGYYARTALRTLDDLRIEHGRLDSPVPVGDEGGSLRVELNHTDSSSLPDGLLAHSSRHPRRTACRLRHRRSRRTTHWDQPSRVQPGPKARPHARRCDRFGRRRARSSGRISSRRPQRRRCHIPSRENHLA